MTGKRRGRGEGTIAQRKSDGRWVGAVTLEEGGRKWVYGKTRAEVAKRLDRLKAQLAGNAEPPNDALTVERWLEGWLATAREAVRPKTAISYAQVVRDHLVPQIGRLKLSRLTPARVEKMVAELQEEDVSRSSAVYARTVLRIALSKAVRQGVLGRNAAALAEVPDVQHRSIEPLSAGQARVLLASLEGDPMRPFYLVALTTGLRLGELLGLRWEDVDLDDAHLVVRQQVQRLGGELRVAAPKTAGSRAAVALAPFTVMHLREHRTLSGRIAGFVFATEDGGPLDPSNVRRHWKKTLKAAGLPDRRLHDLRHSTATFLLEAGVPTRVVQDILRHSNYRTTAGTYQHVDVRMQRDAVGKLGDLFADPQLTPNPLPHPTTTTTTTEADTGEQERTGAN